MKNHMTSKPFEKFCLKVLGTDINTLYSKISTYSITMLDCNKWPWSAFWKISKFWPVTTHSSHLYLNHIRDYDSYFFQEFLSENTKRMVSHWIKIALVVSYSLKNNAVNVYTNSYAKVSPFSEKTPSKSLRNYWQKISENIWIRWVSLTEIAASNTSIGMHSIYG